MNREKGDLVTLGPKGNKKDIGQEPEMKELKRMIGEGEIEEGRTLDHLKEKAKREAVLDDILDKAERIDRLSDAERGSKEETPSPSDQETEEGDERG